MPSRSSRLTIHWGAGWWLLPPVVLGLLGIWLLSHRYSFWYDELFTAEMAPLALRRLLHAVVSGDGTLPYLRDAPPSYNAPYYAISHLWVRLTPFGSDEVGLRMLSLVAAVGAAGVFTRAVARLCGRRVGLAAGLVMATNPFVVAYAAEARGYALALLATSLAALGLARWLDGSPRGVLLYGVAAAAAGLAHWYALLVVGALTLAAVMLRRGSSRPIVLAAALATLPTLALVATAVANGVSGSGAEWIRSAGAAVPALVLRSWAAGNLFLAIATVVAVMAALLLRSPADRSARIVGVLWLGVPVAAVTLMQLLRPVYVDRYLLPSLLGLALLAGLGLVRLYEATRPFAVGVMVAVLGSSVAVAGSNAGRGPREDVRAAVAMVASRHVAGEPIVAAARWDALGVDHYSRRSHPGLVSDLLLAPNTVPDAATLWVIHRAGSGVRGDLDRRADLDRQLTERGMRLVERYRFDGRRADVLAERWQVSG